MATAQQPILIAGAGIAGLTTALALADRGIASSLLERAPALSEVGAGIQLSPNASHVLLGLGLQEELEKTAVTPDAVVVRAGRTGRKLASMPVGKAMAERFGAPYWVIHRGDLQAALLKAALGSRRVSLRLGAEIVSFARAAGGVAVTLADGTRHEGSALIGADGLRSAVRADLLMDGPPQFSGYVAWRGTVASRDAPADIDRRTTCLWMGPDAHLVHYPIRGGKLINVVAVISGKELAPGWGEPGDPAELEPFFASWAAPARDLIGRVAAWLRWALADRAPAARWCDGRVILIGDAAHPTLPFVAQGGAMAIEDAAVLADELADTPDNPEAVFARTTARRIERTTRLQNEARANGRIYHLRAPASLVRDMVLRSMSPARFAARHDWIYSWRADGEH